MKFSEKYHNDADFIAMQKNKFWKPDGKTLCLDAGSFITAIEYATGKEALLIGKPSPIYFRTALKEIRSKISHQKKMALEKALSFGEGLGEAFYMLGDDLETDINAAQALKGGKGILIYTGKQNFLYLPKDVKRNRIMKLRILKM
jgi:ribonucleotide monophosphatase NagD (HAD superfamily)